MWRRVLLVGAIVSDECAAPIFRVNFPAGNMKVARYLERVSSIPNKATARADSHRSLEPQMTHDVNVICDWANIEFNRVELPAVVALSFAEYSWALYRLTYNLFLCVYPSRFNNNISSLFKSISADGQTCHNARGCFCRFLARV